LEVPAPDRVPVAAEQWLSWQDAAPPPESGSYGLHVTNKKTAMEKMISPH